VVPPERREEIERLFRSVSGLSRKITLDEFHLSKKEFETFFQKLITAQKPVFLCYRENANPEIIHWLNSLGYILGQSEAFLALSSASNFQGMLDMGVNHQYLPGYQRVSKPEIISRFAENWDADIPSGDGYSARDAHAMFVKGKVKNALFWSQDPAGSADLKINRSDDSFIIVADMFLTETAKLADVVFPLVPFMETDGMVTNAESRIQQFKKVVQPQSKKENWKILNDLGNKFGNMFRYESASEVSDEIKLIIPEYQKQIAVFRNGYIPDESQLKAVKYQTIRYGANYLLKWLEEFQQNSRNKTRATKEVSKELVSK
jgi:predicted molibdopterin-dependent oxidoreductase YjgC